MVSQEAANFPLAIGPVTIGIRFDAPGNTEAFARYFTGYTSLESIDVAIGFTVASHADMPIIPESLIQSKIWNGGEFSIADGLFSGTFNSADNIWNVNVKNIMTKGQITRVFEQFLYQAFYSACNRTSRIAYLIHSAGVTVDHKGFLFVGASGMGKSTIAGLSSCYGVLNDEMNIISSEPEGIRLHKSPFNAYFTEKHGIPATLSAVFILRHSRNVSIEPCSPAQAVASITGQIVPPLGLEDSYSPAVAATMMLVATELVQTVPVYYLDFPVEGGFWPTILDLFP
jgi:hypothetical protein